MEGIGKNSMYQLGSDPLAKKVEVYTSAEITRGSAVAQLWLWKPCNPA